MDLQNPPSLSPQEALGGGQEETNASDAAAAVVEDAALAVVPPPKADVVIEDISKNVDSQADDVIEATPADVTDTSDAVISSSRSPTHISNVKVPTEPLEAVVDAVSPQPDDDLLREMEEIEGDKKITEGSPAESEPQTEKAEQETSDLLKELENDVGESSDVVMETVEESSGKVIPNNADAESPEVKPIHESPDASCVDSTTDPSVVKTDDAKANSSSIADDSPVASALNTESAAIADDDDESSAMEVDDAPESVAEDITEKDEGISSTSTDDVQSIPVVEVVAPISPSSCTTTAHQEAESAQVASAKQDEAEAKDEDVTSSEDQPDAATTNEADSSDAKIASKTSPNHEVDTELNHTIDNANKAENKVLTNLMMNNGSSTPNSNPVSAAATPNVFNSTPISKQFEISSENVSKIDEHSGAGLASHNASSQEDIKTSDMLTTFSGTETSVQPTSDNLTNYAKVIKKFNGLGSETVASIPAIAAKSDSADSGSQKIVNLVALSNGATLDETTERRLHENDYEISVWYEETEMQYLTVERVVADNNKKASGGSIFLTDASSTSCSSSAENDKASTTTTTNGSVMSVGPFSLPSVRSVAASSSNTSTVSDTKCVLPSSSLTSHNLRVKETVSGAVALCDFMIDHFSQIKHELLGTSPASTQAPTTPLAGRGSKAAAVKKNLSKTATASPDPLDTSVSTPTSKSSRKGGKRAASSALSDTEDEPTPKKAKAQKKEAPPALHISVLARWADKKYYAGHVTDSKPGNKFVVLFEDGASKTLPEEFIVFGGDNDVLPLLDQSVHVLVEGDTYEPGLVTSIDTTGESILYTVVGESKTVTVSSSDIYLEEDQAKVIQSVVRPASETDGLLPDTPSSKRSGRPSAKLGESLIAARRTAGTSSAKKSGQPTATTPEPSTSTAASGGRGAGRRNKRKELQPVVRSFSESSELSDVADSQNVPQSPESGLEAIDGVQPELQKTSRELEIKKMRIISEYLGNDRSRSIEDVIGCLPKNRSLFKNKHFLLTCTITTKRNNSDVSSSTAQSHNKQKDTIFTTLPFLKNHLRSQIEAGGGSVYSYFEEIPKNKYKYCKLVSANPCTTAKYVQCLAASIGVVSHEYIIESCNMRKLADIRRFLLPTGWSLIDQRFIQWPPTGQRKQPLLNATVFVASYHTDFMEFWSRVCRLAGADVRSVKCSMDLNESMRNAYMLTDPEFCEETKEKAVFLRIPVVSTVWVVESLILGKTCAPDANDKLRQSYQDEDY